MDDHGVIWDDDDRIIDLDLPVRPGEPPVPGAQWDELRNRWQHWDAASESWLIVGAETPVAAPVVAPAVAMGASDIGARLSIAEERDNAIDIDRLAAPEQVVVGAQWNEVLGRWERWDDRTNAWVAVPSNVDAF